ncbi:aspartate--tRNA ligase [Candidatus Peregrinibacteria bacterium]|nr:aspartate--tRNA ligase [Candidatus Peregrinibacteria bacterium]
MLRTHTNNQLTQADKGNKVTLCGWVHRRRDHGGVIFIDIRDRYGLTQIVTDPQNFVEAHNHANEARPEFVIKITGTVRLRPEGQSNPNMPTGEIEVLIEEFEILNRAKTPPFEIDHELNVNEELRLKYRYLDLRRDRLKTNIVQRHKMVKMMRDILDEQNFIEVETPILIKGTPEGSREYLVPSRLYPGTFFVLPQSPQQLKQLLMVAGFDRYFQIARCFRDEDLRGDRQPEFTQLDMEMSFINYEDITGIIEDMLIKLSEKLVPEKKIQQSPFPRITWQEAMESYGSDKPDIRFEMKIVDVSDIAEKCNFSVFTNAIKSGGVVKCLKVDGGLELTRKEIDDLTELAKIHGAKGLAYIQLAEEGPKSTLVKHFSEEEIKAFIERSKAKTGDILFFGADSFEIACNSLGQVRLACADRFKLRDKNTLAYLWVYDFPLFEKDPTSGQLAAAHHPFTSPKDDQMDILNSATPEKTIAKAYDIVLNGYEIGGGSIRIHDQQLQKKIFSLLNISDEDAERRFGHMLEAFTYGAPPHGGIALGLERLIMIYQDEPNIREVMAFPKDSKAKDLMLGAPSVMPTETIEELSLEIKQK